MVSSRKFVTSDKDNFPLQIPGFSNFQVHQAGFLGVIDGDKMCKGVGAVRNGELEKWLVEYSIYTVTITPKKFVSDAMALVAVSTQETLSCYPAAGRCAGEMHAYKWNTSPHTKCPYSLVKRAMGIMSPDTFYSHQETLVFNKHLALPPVVQCPGLILIPTQVPSIFLSKHQPQLLPIEGADVRVSALVDALGAYLQEALELHQGQLMDQAVRQHCLQSQQARLQEAIPLGKGTLGKRLWDVWQQYTYTAVTVPVWEAKNCLSAIPVPHTSLGFMNFKT